MGRGCSMSALTSTIAFAWSGVSSYGKASSTSCCHGVSGANGWPGLVEAPAVEHHELLRDLAHRGADARLRLLEVGAAHPVQRRCLAARVGPDAVHLVGRHVQLVAALVLEQQVVARDAADRALHHPLVARDTVHVVDDVVAGGERVVDVGAATRTTRTSMHATPSGEVGLADDRESGRRDHDATVDRRDDDADRARRDRPDRRVDSLVVEHVRETVGRARAVGRQHDAHAVAGESSQPVGEPGGVPHDRVERGRREVGRVGPLGRREHVRRARRRVRQQPVERQREARPLLAGAAVGRAPGDGERRRERRLFVQQLLGAVAHPAGLAREHQRVIGQEVGQEPLLGREPRQPRLHAVERLTLRESFERLRAPRFGAHQLGGPLAHLRTGQHLARGEHRDLRARRASSVGRRPRTPSVGRPRRPTGRCGPGGRR